MVKDRKSKEEEIKKKILEMIQRNQVINATQQSALLDPLPPREEVIGTLNNLFNLRDRNFRVIKVEDIGDYKIYIQVPGGKTDYDFIVWRAIFSNSNEVELKIPKHDDLGKMYLELKQHDPILDEYLINATIRYIRDRWPLNKPENNVITHYFKYLNQNLLQEVMKFFLTLKWVTLQEDVNYPPPNNLGSLYTLSVFAVLEVTGDLKTIRKIIRFKS
ncbi:MAG: hypothetical protein ACPLSM_07975 [Thermosphaera sp.]